MMITGICAMFGSSIIAFSIPTPLRTGLLICNHLKSLPAIDGKHDLMSVIAQNFAKQLANSELVIHDQDFRHCYSPRGR